MGQIINNGKGVSRKARKGRKERKILALAETLSTQRTAKIKKQTRFLAKFVKGARKAKNQAGKIF